MTPEERIQEAYRKGGEFPPAVDSWFMKHLVGKYLIDAIRAAVEEKQEACAKICDDKLEELGGMKHPNGATAEAWIVFHLANRIRNHGKE